MDGRDEPSNGGETRMTARILIVGCGEIGSRHLQAAVTLPSVSAIDIVDLDPDSLARGRQRIDEVPDARREIAVRCFSSLADAAPADLCVVATRATGRYELVRQAAELGCRAFLLEKVVAASLGEYERLQKFAEERGLSIWVNCKTRAYPFHKRSRAMFDEREPIQFHVQAGNHGLACNGVHSIDLFVFYDRCEAIFPISASIDPCLHPSKRGNGIFDLSGTLTAVSNKGSSLVVSFAAGHLGPPVYLVSSARHRFTLDQWQPWAFESDVESRWTWRPADFEGNLLISHMSRAFMADVLETGTCELPTLRDCYPAHAYMLRELHPWFSKLLGRDIDELPIT